MLVHEHMRRRQVPVLDAVVVQGLQAGRNPQADVAGLMHAHEMSCTCQTRVSPPVS